ncbi:MAG: hypothetical protein HY985_09115 [Magnetospirillum sp.]|nr:hypothetical protein [Magnetospirillum sp.]
MSVVAKEEAGPILQTVSERIQATGKLALLYLLAFVDLCTEKAYMIANDKYVVTLRAMLALLILFLFIDGAYRGWALSKVNVPAAVGYAL